MFVLRGRAGFIWIRADVQKMTHRRRWPPSMEVRSKPLPALKICGFVSAVSFKVDCLPHHAVLIAPGLWLASPKNGKYFKCRPETIDDFAPKLCKLGV